MAIRYLIITILCYPGILFSQSADTTLANSTWQIANEFYTAKNYDSASLYYDSAANQFKQAEIYSRAGHCLLRTANCYFRDYKFEEAIPFYDDCIETLLLAYDENDLKLAVPYSNLGRAYRQVGKPFKALEYEQKTYDIRLNELGENDVTTGHSLYNLGILYMDIGDYGKSKNCYFKALPIYKSHFGEYHRKISDVYVNMGILYDKAGDVNHAITYYLKANEIDISMHDETYWLLAYNYNNLGISYNNLENDSLAKHYLEKSLVIANANKLHEVAVSSNRHLGDIYLSREKYETALSFYNVAMKESLDKLGEIHPQTHDLHTSLSLLNQKQSKYDVAEQHLHDALRIVKTLYKDIHPWIGDSYQKLAQLYREQNKFNEARNAIEAGISSVSFYEINFNQETPFEKILNPTVLLDLLVEDAAILEAEYQQTTQLSLLYLALDRYNHANALIDHLRRGYIAEGSKILLQKETVHVYEKAIKLCNEIYLQTDSVKYLEMAFEFSEKNKATILAETIQADEISNIQGVPQNILQEEKTLKQKITLAEQNLANEPESEAISQEIIDLKWQYDSLSKKIADTYPQYYDMKYNLEVASVRSIMNNLAEEQAVLSYFDGDESWYIFCITKNSITLNKTAKQDLSTKELQIFRQAVSDNQSDFSTINHLAHKIYKELVQKPLASNTLIEEITIVPDGILGYLPFDALVSELSMETAKPHFLVEDYALSYVNSMTLQTGKFISDTKPQISYVGFAPDYSNQLEPGNNTLAMYRDAISQLSGTSKEVNFATGIFSGKAFLGDDATEANFKNLNKSTAILHLAMHATVDDEDPNRSKLLFTQSANATDSLEDGFLNAFEIYGLKLASNLAVLSACNTGYGKIQKGEGIMSLSRAFQYAGCPSIVMSLWRAKDQPTTEVMGYFFENLKSGLPKNEALRDAKLKYLKTADPLKAHPANWATFVLLGDTTPVKIPFATTSWWATVIITVFILASMLSYFLRKKKLPA